MSVAPRSVAAMEAQEFAVAEDVEVCSKDAAPVASLAERALIGALEVLASRLFFSAAHAAAPPPPDVAAAADPALSPAETPEAARDAAAAREDASAAAARGDASAAAARERAIAAAAGVDAIAAAAPDPGLVAVLAAMDPAAADVGVLVEGIAAWERVIAWAGARQAQLITAFTDREERRTPLRFLVDHLAVRLAVSRRALEVKLDLADTLSMWPAVADLMSSGAIDATKARAIGDGLTVITPENRGIVLDTVLPDAPRLTAPQMRHRIRKVAAEVDPPADERRMEREAERRCVTMTPASDGMAWLTAYLPADAAASCLTALDALAANADPADPRGMDARRADALTDILRHVLDTGIGPYGEVPTQQRRRPHIQVTVPAGSLLGLDDAPAELAGYGPIPASMARAIAADGTWRRILLDDQGVVCCGGHDSYRPGADLTGTIAARDATCTFPGCRVPARRCDLDHITPFDPERPAVEQTHAGNLHALCRHHHQLKTIGTWGVTRDPRSGTTTWTDPLGRTYRRDPHRLPSPPPAGTSRRTASGDGLDTTRDRELGTGSGLDYHEEETDDPPPF